jgi:hypothetical protein
MSTGVELSKLVDGTRKFRNTSSPTRVAAIDPMGAGIRDKGGRGGPFFPQATRITQAHARRASRRARHAVIYCDGGPG